ncbi:MAG TPA: hypothetical protein VNJ02_11060 [Vicinamibacterales bacterium]|nr:hypothetical protein [Vicinamibacterales bacterium]
MPGFGGMKALHMIREHGLDLPFIFVSGPLAKTLPSKRCATAPAIT